MNQKFFFYFLILILVSTVLVYFTFKSLDQKGSKLLPWLDKFDDQELFVTSILENILTAKIQPKNGQNIFFIDTVRMKKNKKERPFTARQACAIESAGKLKYFFL